MILKNNVKILCFTILFIALIFNIAYATNLNTKLGDINQDGVVSKDDSDLLMKYLAGYDDVELTAEQKIIADVNSDGKINGKDATRVLQIIKASEYKTGDINQDGVVSQSDSDLLMKYLAGHNDVRLTPVQKIIADVNSDGIVNGKDVTRIFKIIKNYK